MPCLVCGASKSVRSHIIPKAFALDIRDPGETHLVAASRQHPTAKPSQSGMVSDDLLCKAHEEMTQSADKYAIEFVRRIAAEWLPARRASSLEIANPQPEMLRKFVAQTIWREVHCDRVPGLTLGPYEAVAREYIFGGGPAPDWPVFVNRTNFVMPASGISTFNLHPYRIKFAGRSGWLLGTAGVGFFLVIDNRGTQPALEVWRADTHNPAPVVASEPMPFTDLAAVKIILGGMTEKAVERSRAHPERSSRW